MRTYQLSPRYYRVFGVAMAGFGAVTTATGALYGDYFQVAGGVGVLLLALPLYRWVGGLPAARARASLYGLTVAGLAVVVLTHAPGTGSGPAFVAFCLSSATSSSSNRVGAGLVLAGVLLVVGLPRLAPAPSPVPPAAGTVAPLLFFGAGSAWFAGRSRARADRRAGELVAAAARLRRDRADLLAARADLRAVSGALADGNAELAVQLHRARRTTDDLAARRADEEQLVAAIHHDLREPLRSVVSFSQLLARRLRGRGDAGRAGEFLALAIDGGRRMTGMLDGLLAYAAPGAEAEAPEPVDLADVAADVTADLASLIERSGAVVSTRGLAVVAGQRALLAQLLLNLVGNALKFSRPGVPPRVDLLGEGLPDGRYRLSVRDNGVGIPPERLGGIFDLFRRVEAEAHREGSGIGLALCRRIALRHGADLTVTSVAGEGSCFGVTFPAEVRSCALPPAAPPPAAPPPAALSSSAVTPPGARAGGAPPARAIPTPS